MLCCVVLPQFIHSMLIMLCLTVLCIVKPYKKYHINVMEGLVILALFSTTLSIYDRDNDFHVGPTVAAVGLAFPFLYGGIFIIYKIGTIVFRKLWYIKSKFRIGRTFDSGPPPQIGLHCSLGIAVMLLSCLSSRPKVEERWHIGERLGNTALIAHWKTLGHITGDFFMGDEEAKQRTEQEGESPAFDGNVYAAVTSVCVCVCVHIMSLQTMKTCGSWR